MISDVAHRSEVLGRAARSGDEIARRWNLVAAAIALLTGLSAALLPLGMSSSVDSNGVQSSSRVSLLFYEGPSVLIVLALPALLVSLPLLLRGAAASHRARVSIVVLLGVFVMLGAMTIGLFFVPTLIAMVLAMSAQTTSRSEPRS